MGILMYSLAHFQTARQAPHHSLGVDGFGGPSKWRCFGIRGLVGEWATVACWRLGNHKKISGNYGKVMKHGFKFYLCVGMYGQY